MPAFQGVKETDN